MKKKQTIDDLIKEFEEKAKNASSKYKKLWQNKESDSIYEVDIHIWRKKGMGNSLQTIAGNKVSIMTATTSYLHTLLSKGIITGKELDSMVSLAKEELGL